MIQDILKATKASMEKGLESVKKDFSTVRAGKASPNMLDTVMVEAYGSMLPLNQVAAVAAPEPRMLLVTPFDKGQLKAIEKAIREAEMGLDPAQNGGIIRVPLPSMNEARRKELVKQLHHLAEEGRVAIRHMRSEARDRLKKLSGVSEDDVKHAEKDLQKQTDDSIAKIEQMQKAKEAELMEV
jgi:ribosome recycling factor